MPKGTTNTLAERLKYAREMAGLSQAQAAELIDAEFTTISRYETGLRQPRDQRLAELADTYKVSRDWLLTGAGLTPESEAKWRSLMARFTPEDVEKVLGLLTAIGAEAE